MPNFDIHAIRQQAKQAFAGFTSGQKAMLGLAALATLIGGYLFMHMSSTTSYAPLYSNLQASDASGVTQQLANQGVPYKLSDGGATILVPEDRVYQLRLDMSAKGFPTDGAPGYSLLDKGGITTSEFKQRVDYQRALEGELSKTINAIDGVLGSTVHLVVPEQDVFASDTQHPSASVLIKLPSGKSLGSGQVQAIVHLVASSVEGLQPENVTVADDQGRMLAAPGFDAGASAGSDARTSQTVAYQDQVARSIEDLLAPVTGPGKAKVTVAAQLDFNKTQTTTESFDQGANAPLVSETTSSETFNGTGAAVGGALSTSPTPVASGTTGDGNYTKTDEQKQYAPSKVTEVVEAAPGAVQRMSIAVVVDDSVAAQPQQIQDLVTAAAGIDSTRGDSVQVQKLTFDTTAADAAQAELDAATKAKDDGQLTNMLRTGGAILIVVVALFLAWRSAKKKSIARYPVAIPLPMAMEELPSGEPAPVTAQPGLPPAVDEERRQVQSQIVELIDRQPGDVANVLRGWLAEKR